MTPNPADAVIGAMKGIIFWMVLIGIASLVLKYFANKWLRQRKAASAEERTGDASQDRYVSLRHVASPPEKILFERLQKALPELVVLAQVHLPRVIQPASKSKAPLERIIRKSLDFVICDAMFVPLVAIEVNDRSHNAGDRIASDIDKAAALKSAGIPLLTWEARKLPNVDAIRAAILEHVALKTEEPAPPTTPKAATPRTRLAPDQQA